MEKEFLISGVDISRLAFVLGVINNSGYIKNQLHGTVERIIGGDFSAIQDLMQMTPTECLLFKKEDIELLTSLSIAANRVKTDPSSLDEALEIVNKATELKEIFHVTKWYLNMFKSCIRATLQDQKKCAESSNVPEKQK